MRDNICTIPVTDVFENNDGCPICKMYATVEEHIIDYIMGAAMMEPDIRIKTNDIGFCTNHYRKMLNKRGRLQLALMLESHIKEKNKEIFKKVPFNTYSKKSDSVRRLSDSCFVCEKINWGMDRMIETIYRCYETEKDFRDMFDSQNFFCLPHYQMLIDRYNKKSMKKYGSEFLASIDKIVSNNINELCEKMTNYCKKYSYDSDESNCDWDNCKNAVEDTIEFLNGIID